MATLDTRKFLDYNGLETFWNGIKSKFAEQTAIDDLQGEVNGLAEQFNNLNGSITAQLTSILAQVNQKSPLIVDYYTDAVNAANKDALPGSIIYVKYSEGDYNPGPYIVTVNNALLYIPTRDGNIDFDDADAEEIFNAIAGIREELNTVKTDYATKEELKEAIANIQGSNDGAVKIQVVSELPEKGELGTIYIKPNNLYTEDNKFTEYIYVQHGGINMYEKIGVGAEDLENYVKSSVFNEKITQINAAIVAAKNDAVANVQSSIISKDDKSFGNEMTIPIDDITALINDN